MTENSRVHIELKIDKDYLICLDSDGCVFDTMEIKHKECIIPCTINHWELQKVSKYARETAEFVNLYSKWRGINRFPALINVLDLLEDRPEVRQRGYTIPDIQPLRVWVENETKLSNPALEKAICETGDPLLIKTLNWSNAVTDSVNILVRGVPPFPYVVECLEVMQEKADIIVASTSNNDELKKEWQEHDLDRFVKSIAGQEMGLKKEILAAAKADRYADNHVLMVGDAPGDLMAARAVNALFFPINPGDEVRSWERFYNEAMDKFFAGSYAGAYEESLIAEFDRCLPSRPPWVRK